MLSGESEGVGDSAAPLTLRPAAELLLARRSAAGRSVFIMGVCACSSLKNVCVWFRVGPVAVLMQQVFHFSCWFTVGDVGYEYMYWSGGSVKQATALRWKCRRAGGSRFGISHTAWTWWHTAHRHSFNLNTKKQAGNTPFDHLEISVSNQC